MTPKEFSRAESRNEAALRRKFDAENDKAFPPEDDRQVTVCAECLRACCWQGTDMCEISSDADITTRTVRELKALGLESSDYWKTDDELA